MNGETSSAADEFLAKASAFWLRKGGRITYVRKVICGHASRRDIAYTAEELWTDCRKIEVGISIASVYRTIADLIEAGLVREIPRPNEQRMFMCADENAADKGFLVCKNCARVIPLDDDCLALREGAAIRTLGFQTNGMRLLIEANCEALKHQGTCTHEKKSPA